MAVFHYKGFSAAGQSVAGTVDAVSEKTALDLLGEKGIVPVALKAARAASPGARTGFSLRGGRVSPAVRALFARELATFLEADIPLLEALQVIRDQESQSVFRTVLEDIHDRVQGGEDFSKALAAHPRVFSPLLVSMVEVGETGGMLGSVLNQMANWMEREEEVRSEIRAAMAYPLMILTLGVVTVFVLVSFVLPRITTIFSGMEASLPLPTKVLMGVSSVMGQWWWAMLLGLAAILLLGNQIMKTAAGRAFYDRASLALPLFGKLTMRSAVARFSRACAALLGSGVPLLDSLLVVRGLMGNSLIVAMVQTTIDNVTNGRPLARSLGESRYFPSSVIHLISVGERTGRLGEMFDRVATRAEKQTSAQIKVLLNLLSPLMIIALAIMVALIAISVLLPIFQMNKMMR